MTKNLRWKALLIVIVVGLAFWRAYPPLDIYDKDGDIVQEGTINLGLDLQGGMYLILEVDMRELTDKEKKNATDRAITTIQNRLDPTGVKEPIISKIGKDRILVQLPGETDREQAIKRIKQVAHLEFRLVSEDPDLIKKAFGGETVEGYDVLETQPKEGQQSLRYLVSKEVEMKGEHIARAEVDFNQQKLNEPIVKFSLDGEGAKIFRKVTEENIRKQLAIVLDGRLISAPRINAVIPTGDGLIEGYFSEDEAKMLADVLESGALPAPVNIIEERTVGPTLGRDSIEKGVRAIIIGGIIVLVFMAVYYLLAGMIANFALLLNLILITGTLAYFKGTLTLPGIAGLVLTIGMAVDANVLIFERIREESNVGKSIRAAIQSGFNRAFLTILDANITTLIAALVLLQLGTGPVKGFATILSIGIFSSMFTALVVTRLVLDLITSWNRKMKKLTMMRIVGKTNINFIDMRRIAYILSVIVIIFGIVRFVDRGKDNYGIDFTGGTIQQIRFDDPVETEVLRNKLRAIGLGSAYIQRVGNDREFIIRSLELDPKKILGVFEKDFGQDSFEVLRVEKVGPSVGKDLKKKAINALLVAMVCMVIYISMRFEFRFAIAAIVALLHDVFISLGVLSIANKQISTPVIAALLTIVGYSINDTIVVFDRIREDRKLMRKSSYKDIINTSINQTLSRTLLTSLTTLAVVLALYLLGGEVINDFAFVLLVGVMVGTYSSIFIASPILIDWPSKKVRKR